MESFFKWQSHALKLWVAQSETAIDTWATISMRLPVLVRDGMSGEISPETLGMVSEKVIASTEGAIDASHAGAKLALNFWTGRLDGSDVPNRLVHIMEAASKPARVKVRANALRLTGR